MEKAKALGKAALNTEEGRRASENYTKLMAELAAYEAATVADWCQLLSDTSDQKLKQPLLRHALPPCQQWITLYYFCSLRVP